MVTNDIIDSLIETPVDRSHHTVSVSFCYYFSLYKHICHIIEPNKSESLILTEPRGVQQYTGSQTTHVTLETHVARLPHKTNVGLHLSSANIENMHLFC